MLGIRLNKNFINLFEKKFLMRERKMMTLEDAKKKYLKYDCSLFALAREEPNAYKEYKKLNISITLEEKWRQELFEILFNNLKAGGAYSLFIRLYDLSENGDRKNKKRLYALKEALNYIIFEDLKINICIAETIIGRKSFSERTGLIFWAFDLREKKFAEELLLIVMELLSYQPKDEGLSRRFELNRRKCYLLDSQLQLNVLKSF